MRTNLDNALTTLITAGWANDTHQATTGDQWHWAVIDATTERDIMGEILDEIGLTLDDVPAAWYIVAETDDGHVFPLRVADLDEARSKWAALTDRRRANRLS